MQGPIDLGIDWVDLDHLISVVLIAVGISHVITGTRAGFPARVTWWLITHKIPLVSLDSLAFCPSCNAWWSGLVAAVLTGSTFWVALQCAFASCVVAAIVQATFGLAAADEEKIRSVFRRNDDGEAEQE